MLPIECQADIAAALPADLANQVNIALEAPDAILLPIMTVPASFNWLTIAASCSGTKSPSSGDKPAVRGSYGGHRGSAKRSLIRNPDPMKPVA